jgi:aspartyl-tRNA(Asn)/glutamyl-tRNA(Gln) amidotransferase subunit C
MNRGGLRDEEVTLMHKKQAMKITRHDVKHVAGLARLKFTDDELELFTDQMNTLLSYFDTLQQLDTTGVEPSTHAVNLSNAFRDDRVRQSLAGEEALKNAPAPERGCFKVPKIIEG